MSDEQHLESAWRHRDITRVGPWHGLSPDEEAMAREEAEETAPVEDEIAMLSTFQSRAICYLLAGGAEDWRAVAFRLRALCVELDPAEYLLRPLPEALRGYFPPPPRAHFPIKTLLATLASSPGMVGRLLGFWFGGGGAREDWLRRGAERIYLLGAQFHRATTEEALGCKPSLEAIAAAFGEISDRDDLVMRSRARSRWSAKAQTVLVRPVERATGRAGPAVFGDKGHVVRELYREAARGNTNRRGKRCPRHSTPKHD